MKPTLCILLCTLFTPHVFGALGDIDNDGSITLSDCKLLAQQIVSGAQIDPAIGDINGDETVSIIDAMRLHQSIGGLWIEPTGSIAPVPQVSEEERTYLAQYEELCDRYESMAPETFINSFQPAPQYTSTLEPQNCTYFHQIDSAFGLSTEQKAILKEQGMVVLDRTSKFGTGFGGCYREIFKNDLPVFFTSDALLDPLYKMYDKVLMNIEKKLLIPLLTEALTTTLQHLDDARTQSAYNGILDDAYTYLKVADALLNGESNVAGNEEVNRYLASIAEENLAMGFQFFGSTLQAIDFSQFTPRGHYECGELDEEPCALSQYFKSMMWLGRADCALNMDSLHQLRMFAAIYGAMEESEALDNIARINEVVSFFVGDIDALSLEGFAEVYKNKSIDIDSVLISDTYARKLCAAIKSTGGGNQLILSQAIWKEPNNTRPELPTIAQICGQRFILDSYLLGRTVESYVTGRNKPFLEEVPFCLGNNAAITIVADDIRTYTKSAGDYKPYHTRLGAARTLFEKYPYWNRNCYTLWLSSLQSLSTELPATVPAVMQSRTWQEKQMNTQLASWAQLRHNTLLYAKQSYTMGIVCFYPDGYVEPYPQFYRTIGTLITQMGEFITQLGGTPEQYGFYPKSWKAATDTLALIAEYEIEGKPLTSEHLSFLNRMLVTNPLTVCGASPVIGWYTELFSGTDDLLQATPCIADVHTIPPNLVKPDNMVLHAATGNASFAIIQAATDNDCGTLYVGAVSSFYQHDEKPINRLADSEWKTMLQETQKPGVPSWFGKYIK